MKHTPKYQNNDIVKMENPITIEIRKSDHNTVFFQNIKTMTLEMGIGKIIKTKKSWINGKYKYLVANKAYGILTQEWYQENELTHATQTDIQKFKEYFHNNQKMKNFMNGLPIKLDWIEN
jgi:hypothetical protein